MLPDIHFQYNGFLFGFMMLSIFYIQTKKNWLFGSFLFSTLINLKHIYLYIAPAFFFYILFFYCLTRSITHKEKLVRLIKVALAAIIPFVISLGPFVYMGQISQLVSSLFPFKRGLCHAYWAPNFWAIYNFFDKLLTVLYRKIGRESETALKQTSSSTSGLVQDIEHFVLPSVQPIVTFIISLVCILVPTIIFVYKWNSKIVMQKVGVKFVLH